MRVKYARFHEVLSKDSDWPRAAELEKWMDMSAGC